MELSFQLHLVISAIFIYKASSDFTTEYVGCYVDSNGRGPSKPFTMKLAETMFANASVEKCSSICYSKGKKYVGLKLTIQCSCSDGGYDIYGESPGECTAKCRGNSSQMCGGYRHNSVYRIVDIGTANTTVISSSTASIASTASTASTATHTFTLSTSTTSMSTASITPTSVRTASSTTNPSTNTRPTTEREPDSSTTNLGTNIVLGVGAVAGCAALIIVVLIMVKRRTRSKVQITEGDLSPAGDPHRTEANSELKSYVGVKYDRDTEETTLHFTVNDDEYAIVNKKSFRSHQHSAYENSEQSDGVNETYKNAQEEPGSIVTAHYSTIQESGNEDYVTVPGSVTTSGEKVTADADTAFVENDLYGT